jgi:hypothetical protein
MMLLSSTKPRREGGDHKNPKKKRETQNEIDKAKEIPKKETEEEKREKKIEELKEHDLKKTTKECSEGRNR